MSKNYLSAMHAEVSLLFYLAKADNILLPEEIANIYHHALVASRTNIVSKAQVTAAMENPMNLKDALKAVCEHPIEEKLLLLEFLALNCSVGEELKLEEQLVLQTIVIGIFPEQSDIAIQFVMNVLERQVIFDAFGIPLAGMDALH